MGAYETPSAVFLLLLIAEESCSGYWFSIVFHAPQQQHTPLYNFMWSSTFWLCCCGSILQKHHLELIAEYLEAIAAAYYSTMLEFSGLFRMAYSFTNVCKGRPHGHTLAFTYPRHKAPDFKDISQYFCPYNVASIPRILKESVMLYLLCDH